MIDRALVLLAVFLASWILTAQVRRYALRAGMLDQPGPRSSHRIPTPTGGGLAIAFVALATIALAAGLGWLPKPVAAALVGGGLPIAYIGWADDRRGTSPGARLAVQAAAAAWAVWCLGVPPSLSTDWVAPGSGPVGALIGIIGIVWATNCFNFMDGIDGLAGGEAVTVGLAGALLLSAGGHGDLAFVSLVIAASSAGFLIWNWAPARIFMGDIGSGLLGFTFATLAVASEGSGALPLVGWLVLLGVFAFDATATLLRRAWQGERWYLPHRTHAYQRAVQSGWSHARVSSAVVAVNVGLALIVWAGVCWPRLRFPLLLVALAGLAALYWGVQRIWASRNVADRTVA